MGPMTSYPLLAHTLTNALHLERAPVAVCFADVVPPGVKQFQQDAGSGRRPAVAYSPPRPASTISAESASTPIIWKPRREHKKTWATL